MNIKIISAIVLILIAAVMLYLGINNGILPPSLTGVGFLFIALVFLTDKKK